MATPYERLRDQAADAPPGRPALTRPLDGRWLGGVCAGIAEHLGVSRRWVHVAMIVLALTGPGLPVYLFLWVVTPSSDTGGVQREPGALRAVSGLGESRWGMFVAAGGLLVLIGTVVGLQWAGVDVRAGILLPLLLIAGGVAVAWSHLDDAERTKWLGTSPQDRGLLVLRLGLGIAVAVIGILVLTVRGNSFAAIGDALLATLAVLVGTTLIAAPWVVRLWRDYREEQEVAARANERADIAAHLHDSVLQTLALIQRRSHDPASVTQLARAQERELRSWLYAGPAGSDETLASAVTAAAHDVEDHSGVVIDLVVTGDRPLEEHGTALVRAMREAMLNATRHGKPPVTAYAEIGPTGVEAFVRDRGEGFDLDDIPEDRLGVRASILGRMERHGGTARVRRREDGTEVELTLPPLEGDES
ncbi:ATP-binding protein [Knoellia subterranea]|uniref:Histidine kinase n=1 Tax=Knoellia subterranea KCTC 19937 TaxID=1385521 RepID=A0A0A0JKQ4_9MICO|nr:ATP-binding protein [Knoellia subterranea]KGN37349.1 histidine kinase [Knoellia subterranea KCTC 19937]